MSSLFIVNLLTLMSGMLPCIGFLISRTEIKRKIWVLPLEAGFLVLAAFLMSGFAWAGTEIGNPVFYSFACLVGSEMCIRDRPNTGQHPTHESKQIHYNHGAHFLSSSLPFSKSFLSLL